jgi:hypothetical protein
VLQCLCSNGLETLIAEAGLPYAPPAAAAAAAAAAATDWIDGLETFIQQIQHKGWLGGWLLPQVCCCDTQRIVVQQHPFTNRTVSTTLS